MDDVTPMVLVGDEITDEDLAELALSADPTAPLADDAVPLSLYLSQMPSLLPSWYMPAAMARTGGSRWRTAVVLGMVAVFITIEALGLCSVYGHIVVG